MLHFEDIMIEVLNRQPPIEETPSKGRLEKDVPVIAGTTINDAKSILTKQVCHNCFKFVNDVNLSDVAKLLPICPSCEERRRSNQRVDTRQRETPVRAKEVAEPISGITPIATSLECYPPNS